MLKLTSLTTLALVLVIVATIPADLNDPTPDPKVTQRTPASHTPHMMA